MDETPEQKITRLAAEWNDASARVDRLETEWKNMAARGADIGRQLTEARREAAQLATQSAHAQLHKVLTDARVLLASAMALAEKHELGFSWPTPEDGDMYYSGERAWSSSGQGC